MLTCLTGLNATVATQLHLLITIINLTPKRLEFLANAIKVVFLRENQAIALNFWLKSKKSSQFSWLFKNPRKDNEKFFQSLFVAF